MISKWKPCILFTIFILLSGCGFHLRGVMEMPRWLNHVAIIIDHAHRDIGPYLEEYLQSYNITVDESPASAKYWLVVEQDNLQQHIASVSSSTTPRQYEIVYTLQFKLLKAKGAEILPTSTVSVTRQATINSDRILGSNQEEILLINEMRRDAVVQLINRISKTVGRSPPGDKYGLIRK